LQDFFIRTNPNCGFFVNLAYNGGMEKEKAIQLAGGVTALAALLGIKRAAVYQWGDSLPQARVWQLKTLKPEWFSI
jgi:hypothetical protein